MLGPMGNKTMRCASKTVQGQISGFLSGDGCPRVTVADHQGWEHDRMVLGWIGGIPLSGGSEEY